MTERSFGVEKDSLSAVKKTKTKPKPTKTLKKKRKQKTKKTLKDK